MKLQYFTLGGLTAFIFFFIFCFCMCACCFIFFATAASNSDGYEEFNYEFEEIELNDSDSQNKIAVIDINGTIFSVGAPLQTGIADTQRINAEIDKALADPDVKGILLLVDSPGGEVIASDELYNKILEAKAKVPVVVYSQHLMASGAVYSSVGANYIVVHPFNLSGSIGVYTELINYDGLLEKLGIDVKRVTNTNGKYKTGDTYFDDNDKDVPDVNLVESLDTVYEKFLEVILANRPVDETKLRNEIALGQVYTPEKALEYKMIDQIGSRQDAINKLYELAQISDARQIDYIEDYGFNNIFYQSSNNIELFAKVLISREEVNVMFK